jgi:hypothetical protein
MSKPKNYILFIKDANSHESIFAGVYTCTKNAIEGIKEDYILMSDIQDKYSIAEIHSMEQNVKYDSNIAEVEFTTSNEDDRNKLFDQ